MGRGFEGRMTTELCAMAPMVEARRDGRLDARESASIERHIAGCASCRALEAELGRLAELSRRPLRSDVSPLEHQRGRVSLLRAAASVSTGAERAAPRRPRLAAALAVAAIALLGAAGAGLKPSAGPAPLALKLPRPPTLPLEMARAEATVTASPGSGDARFERTRADDVERVALYEGAIDLQVPRLGPRARFLVTTADAEVEVRGTRFRVEAHRAHIAAVAVTEGKVEVRYQGTSTLLLPGMSWAPAAPTALATPTAPAASVTDAAALSAGAPSAGPGASAARPLSRRAPAAVPAPPRATSAFADGVRLIERGDYAAAAEKLEAFSAAAPGDERAEDAAFLAVLALQRAGRLDAAAVAARRYLDRYPRGRRRADAEAIAAAR